MIPLVLIKRPSRASRGLVSEQPHVFAICLQGGVDFRGKVYALIDDHASFAGRQPAGADYSRRSSMRSVCDACGDGGKGRFPQRVERSKTLPEASPDVGVGSASPNLW